MLICLGGRAAGDRWKDVVTETRDTKTTLREDTGTEHLERCKYRASHLSVRVQKVWHRLNRLGKPAANNNGPLAGEAVCARSMPKSLRHLDCFDSARGDEAVRLNA
jgi:hypothetical protein